MSVSHPDGITEEYARCFLEDVLAIWLKNPRLRFGQFIVTQFGFGKKNMDIGKRGDPNDKGLFFIEDNILLKKMLEREKWFEENL